MEKNVPIRRVEIYHADDGRRIEKYIRHSEVLTQYDDKMDEDALQFSEDQITYLGILQIDDGLGTRELRFEISGADSEEAAFGKFNDVASPIIKEIYESQKKQQDEEQQEIIPASEADLNAIDRQNRIIEP